MKKKIALGVVALVAVAGGVAGMSAFEAHVINVTAKIENALRVSTTEIDFGTVFPQEKLDKPLEIALSQSFIDADRVDDVEYVIRQKPKCAITAENGTILVGPTATGHVIVDPATGKTEIECGPKPRVLVSGETWGVLPSLCEYISKHPDLTPDNDDSLDSFHEPWTVVEESSGVFGIRWTDTRGHLAKAAGDLIDNWIIDLAVPCFGGNCAQDWESFVEGVNPTALPADQWTQPITEEHKIFGCDLWVEVRGISLPPGIGCSEKADLMLVLDRSGSIEPDEMAILKTAAKLFVDAIAPTADGAHMGQVSFSTTASLDVHLTDDVAALKAAIDALVSTSSTNLEDAILTATTELGGADGHDRADATSPDFMVIITDGAPTASNGGDPSTAATAAADAADAAGIEIFVVGVGTTSSTADYLRDNIATDSGHFFDASVFGDLGAILDGLTECKLPA